MSLGSSINRAIRESVSEEMSLELRPRSEGVSQANTSAKASRRTEQQVYKRCDGTVHSPPTRTQGQLREDKA